MSMGNAVRPLLDLQRVCPLSEHMDNSYSTTNCFTIELLVISVSTVGSMSCIVSFTDAQYESIQLA